MIRITGTASPRWVIDTTGTPGEAAGNTGKTRYNGGQAADVAAGSETGASIAPAASDAASGLAHPVAPTACPDARSTDGKCVDVDAFARGLTRAQHLTLALTAASAVRTILGDGEQLSQALRAAEDANARLVNSMYGVPRE